ncbi:hypothetical protein PILCRDRAFT_716716 [Piloderma croceum F 1598]|uniref:G domain-containing protein n=1 Tax=Piloderma croceum (strain F 1598) TaxID=765440 RepID=A0A0C3B9E5_PILCF|nr:hypothetical protein PILCRDRAFT_716716 [Piloderma croceum F 1598]
MGPTGAGKSTLIDVATGQDGHTVGHGMESHTSDIRSVRVPHPIRGHPMVFVDTPGFDDTYKSDTEILTIIANWLLKTHKGKANLATIIYLHRITDNRMAGSLLKNLRMFISLCGQEAMPNVIIATTMWGEVKKENGERREKELKETFWKDLMDEGCRVERFEDTYESAWFIIDRLATEDWAKMRLSHEMVDRRLTLQQTEAGITLNNELKRLIKARKDASRRLRAQAKKQDNSLIVQELNVQQAEIDEQITKTAGELQKLKIPFAAHIRTFLSSLTR